VRISNEIRVISESVFEGCRSLKEVDLPTKLVKISRGAFKGCTSLTQIILPVGMKTLGFDAFADCTSLRRIALPKGLSEIEDFDAFSSCDSLTDISFGGSEEEFSRLMRGRVLTLQRSNTQAFVPKIHFMDLKI
jgi:hypothetical protein